MNNEYIFLQGSKLFWIKMLGLTNFGTQMLGVKKMLGDKTFLGNKCWGSNILRVKFFRGVEMEWSC